MKKYFFTMMTAALFFASCTSDDAIENGGTQENQDDLVEIKLGTGSRIGTSVTESRAAVDEWNGNQIGVFLLAKGEVAWEDNDTDNSPVHLNNELGTVGTDAENETDNTPVTFTATKYYPRFHMYDYDFYAYHPYVATSSINEGVVTVTGDFTGAEDIMAGKAASVDGGYSAKYFRDNSEAAAPDIKFEHLTTRLKINVLAGDEYNPATCTISNLGMELPTTYTLVVASRNEDYAVNSITWGETSAPVTFLDEYALPEGETESEIIADILVQPGMTVYTLNMNLPGVEGVTPALIKLNGDVPFEAGKAYNVTLKINGPKEIIVTASLTAWENGEDITVEI